MTSLRRLPKVELHRHLEGSVRFETWLEIAREARIELPSRDPGALRRLYEVQPREPRTLAQFLSKFRLLFNLYPDRDSVRRVAREAVEDARRDGVVHLELRFSPVHLARRMKADATEAAGWVIEAARSVRGIEVRFIITFGRDFDVRTNEPSLRAAIAHRGSVVGVDLAGSENRPAAPFARLLTRARREGLRVTVHAGEGGGPANVREAIEDLGAERIGHGVRAVEDPATLVLATARGVTFEMCPTSNLQTGACARLRSHPLRPLLRAGLPVTINTDDPAICGTDLVREYERARREMGLTFADLAVLARNAAAAAFVDDPEALAERIGEGWAKR